MKGLNITDKMLSDIPHDLKAALNTNIRAREQWNKITEVSKMDFIRWISSAKQESTRKRRIDIACSKLNSGEKRPCCYATVPMELYTALNSNKKAKNNWAELTPVEKRKLVYWIDLSDSVKDKENRVKKACALLES